MSHESASDGVGYDGPLCRSPSGRVVYEFLANYWQTISGVAMAATGGYLALRDWLSRRGKDRVDERGDLIARLRETIDRQWDRLNKLEPLADENYRLKAELQIREYELARLNSLLRGGHDNEKGLGN